MVRKGLTEIVLGTFLLIGGLTIATKDTLQSKEQRGYELPGYAYALAGIGSVALLLNGFRKYKKSE